MKKRLLIVISSIVVAVAVIVGAVIIVKNFNNGKQPSTPKPVNLVYHAQVNASKTSINGTYLFNQSTNELTIEHMKLGDVIAVDIGVNNYSTANVVYRTIIEPVEDNGLIKGVNIAIDGISRNSNFAYTGWSKITPLKTTDLIEVKISLPSTASIEYQQKTAKFRIAIEMYEDDGGSYNTENGLRKNSNGNILINNAIDLKIFSANVNAGINYSDKLILLTTDINFGGNNFIAIGNSKDNSFTGSFNGQNHTISNFIVNNSSGAGLFGFVEYMDTDKAYTSTIKNLKIDNAVITGHHYAGAVAGYICGEIINCKVTNSSINIMPELIDDVYDNGDKAGALAGWVGYARILNNKASNISIKAYRDLGGLVGCVGDGSDAENIISNNTLADITLVYQTSVVCPSNDNQNANKVIGCNQDDATVENNIVTNVIIPQ